MKLFKWLRLKTFAVNMFIFMLFSAVISYVSAKMPKRLFYYNRWVFREMKWESDGQIYQRLFKVKIWKKFVPELSDFIKCIFPKKYIKVYNTAYLSNYLIESCRAEFTHWNIIMSSFLFSLWNDTFYTIIMIMVAVVLNLPYIIIQRYNRPRITKALCQMKHMAQAAATAEY